MAAVILEACKVLVNELVGLGLQGHFLLQFIAVDDIPISMLELATTYNYCREVFSMP